MNEVSAYGSLAPRCVRNVICLLAVAACLCDASRVPAPPGGIHLVQTSREINGIAVSQAEPSHLEKANHVEIMPNFNRAIEHSDASPEHKEHSDASPEHKEHSDASPQQKALVALALGTASGLSLPVGAVLGIKLAPVCDQTCGRILAFGAGSLLFAVTVAIFGKMLRHVHGADGQFQGYACVAGAFCGAVFFLTVNSWLEEEDEPKEEKTRAASKEKTTATTATPNDGADSGSESVSSSGGASSVDSEQAYAMGLKPSQNVNSQRATHKRSAIQLDNIIGVNAERFIKLALPKTHEDEHSKAVAFSLFLGLLIDGVPEAIFMGFLAAEGGLSAVLVISLLIANFPEAFSSASLLERARVSRTFIISLWLGLCVLVGSLCGLACYLLLLAFPDVATGAELPPAVATGVSVVEGFTAGAMLAGISSVMIPEAVERAHEKGATITSAGFLVTAGFLFSVLLEINFPSGH